MKLIKCISLNLYLNKLGGEISNDDMVFVEDVQEVYVGGQPYGKDPSWNSYFNIGVGEYLLKDNTVKTISTLQESDKQNIVGICIGIHPTTKEFMIIPGNPDFVYSTRRKWCTEVPVPFEMPEVTPVFGQETTKLDGMSYTNTILDYASKNSKEPDFFTSANFCKSFSPGYRDGDWYLPSVGELTILANIWNTVKPSIDNIYPSLTMWNNLWSSNLFSNLEGAYFVSLVNGKNGNDNVTANQGCIPFLQIEPFVL